MKRLEIYKAFVCWDCILCCRLQDGKTEDAVSLFGEVLRVRVEKYGGMHSLQYSHISTTIIHLAKFVRKLCISISKDLCLWLL